MLSKYGLRQIGTAEQMNTALVEDVLRMVLQARQLDVLTRTTIFE